MTTTFELHVIDGPEAGRVFPLEPGSVVLAGRSNLCAIQLADETVAPRQCSDDFVARYGEHEWPGNCRELRIAVQDRLRHGAEETVSDAIEIVTNRPGSNAPPPDILAEVVDNDLPFVRARHEVLAEFERRYVDHALDRAGHNVARAAANSGIAHRYFQVLKSRRKNARA